VVELTLLQFQVTIPIDHQQQLDMVTLEFRKDIIINKMVRYGTEKEWDLIGLREGERGCTDILGVNRHKKNSLQRVATEFGFCYNMVCLLSTLQRIHRTPFNVHRSSKLHEESQVTRLGFFGLWQLFYTTP
jgi:hypothetical protein